MALTPLALTHADILHALADNPPLNGPADAARLTGRAVKNIGRDIQMLRSAEPPLVTDGPDGLYLTPAGATAQQALRRAEGAASPASEPPSQGVLHSLIVPDPDQPRKHFDDDEIETLADVMVSTGWVSPLLVRPLSEIEGHGQAHRLCAGERRWRAIGLMIETGRWPADRPVPVEIRDMDDATHARIALIENIQRKGLLPLEEARAFRRLIEVFEASTDSICREIGMTQRFVQQRLQLLNLSDEDQARLNSGAINIEDARRILASKPEPVNLPDDMAVVLLEIAHRVATDDDAYLWTNITVGAAVHHDPVMTLLFDGQLAYRGFSASRGDNFVSMRSHGLMPRALWELIGVDKLDADAIAAALETRYAAANARPAEGRTYIHSWLNAPFDITKAQKTEVAEARRAETERAARYQVQQQERQAALQARRGLAGELEAIAFGGAAARPDTAIADALSRAGHPLPWSWSTAATDLFDANGDTVDLHETQDLLGPLVMALVNATAGAPPRRVETLPDADDDDTDDGEALNVADLVDQPVEALAPAPESFGDQIKRVVREAQDETAS